MNQYLGFPSTKWIEKYVLRHGMLRQYSSVNRIPPRTGGPYFTGQATDIIARYERYTCVSYAEQTVER